MYKASCLGLCTQSCPSHSDAMLLMKININIVAAWGGGGGGALGAEAPPSVLTHIYLTAT